MDYKDKDKIVKSMLKNYLKVDNNLYISNKLFIANTAINWIFSHTKDINIIKYYMKDVEKHLKGDLQLSWINGILTKKKVIQNDKI